MSMKNLWAGAWQKQEAQYCGKMAGIKWSQALSVCSFVLRKY
jgi:hypothetical protein